MLVTEEMEEDMASDEQMDDMLTVREVARLLHVASRLAINMDKINSR